MITHLLLTVAKTKASLKSLERECPGEDGQIVVVALRGRMQPICNSLGGRELGES